MRPWVLCVSLGGCMLADNPNADASLCVPFDRFNSSTNWDGSVALNVSGTVVAHKVDPVDSSLGGMAGVRCDGARWRLSIRQGPGQVFDLWYDFGTARDENLPLAVDDEVDIDIHPVLSFGHAMGMVVRDDAGLVAAMELGTWGPALPDNAVDGLRVTDGDPVGRVSGGCGTEQVMHTLFTADDGVQVAPVGHAALPIRGVATTAYALARWGFVEGTVACTDVAGEQSWAVVRDL